LLEFAIRHGSLDIPAFCHINTVVAWTFQTPVGLHLSFI
jgi:hypothetical protein